MQSNGVPGTPGPTGIGPAAERGRDTSVPSEGPDDSGRRGGASRLGTSRRGARAGRTCAPRAAPARTSLLPPPPLPSCPPKGAAPIGCAILPPHVTGVATVTGWRKGEGGEQAGNQWAAPRDERGGRGEAAARALFSRWAAAVKGLSECRNRPRPAGTAAMSGAGADRPSPAKLRRLEAASETDPTVVSTRRETSPPAGGRREGGGARAPGAASGHAQCAGDTAPPGGGLETTASLRGGLKTTVGPKGRLETDVTPCLEQGKGGLETSGEVTGSLETTGEVTGSLKTSNGHKGSLETAVTRCLEQGKGSLETTSEVMGSLKTNGHKGSLETTVTRRLEQGKRDLETTNEVTGSLKTTSEVTGSLKTTNRRKGSLETAVTRCLEQGRRSKGGLETATELKECLETATIACSQQSRGEKRVPEPKGGPAPSVRQKGHSPEECAVISLGEDEEEEEEEEGPRRYLAALEAVQLELEAVEEQAAHAFRRLRAKFWLRRRPHLQRRNRLIQHIPGFWVTAVSFFFGEEGEGWNFEEGNTQQSQASGFP